MNKQLVTAIGLAAISSVSWGANVSATCETQDTIDIANMGWASASTLAHIEATILSKGFGCKTNMVPGDTVPTATSMAKRGEPDIGPEVWLSNVENILTKGEISGNIKVAGLVTSGLEGWWIPEYLAKKYPDLKSVDDLPKYKHLFEDPEEPGKGRFYSCPPGWTCEIYNKNLFSAYGLNDDYNLFSPGSGASLDASIARAYLRKAPWVGYYWAPTAVLGKYKMVALEMGSYDIEGHRCNGSPDCQTPYRGNFPEAEVVTVVSTSLHDKAPDVYEFLSKVRLDSGLINQLLAWGEENRADPEEIAAYFLENHPDVWQSWVSQDVAEHLKSSL